MRSHPSKRLIRSAGFSLVELLIAISLSLFLTLAMMSFFISHKATHHAHAALSQLQENARYLNSYLGQELRLSGFLGCSIGPHGWHSALKVTGDPWDFTTYPNGISAHRFDTTSHDWQPAIGQSTHLPLNLTNADPNSDVMVIRRIATQTVELAARSITPLPGSPPVAAIAPAMARSISIDKPSGALWVFNTCRDHATLFSACRITGSTQHRLLHFTNGSECRPQNNFESEPFNELLNQFEHNSGELGFLEMRAYYVNQNHELVEVSFNGSGDYDTQPVVRGVDSFRVTLMEREPFASAPDAEDSLGSSPQEGYFFRAPNKVDHWENITAVQLDLLLGDPSLTSPLKRAVSWVVHLRNTGSINAKR